MKNISTTYTLSLSLGLSLSLSLSLCLSLSLSLSLSLNGRMAKPLFDTTEVFLIFHGMSERYDRWTYTRLQSPFNSSEWIENNPK